ncbi:unnamed protein product [Caenorhabditis auriculariae]|uniref:Uncharacterized protein n=1 Tax=Caenorhabditis auriculariae TaxID=2777116 RepID=A0A8S1GTQ6_9PELO|nr:unnamed protein product [Caenorhabditis auriculariae]
MVASAWDSKRDKSNGSSSSSGATNTGLEQIIIGRCLTHTQQREREGDTLWEPSLRDLSCVPVGSDFKRAFCGFSARPPRPTDSGIPVATVSGC